MKLKTGKYYKTNNFCVQFSDYFSEMEISEHYFASGDFVGYHNKNFLILEELTPTENSSVYSYKVLVDGKVKLLQFSKSSRLFLEFKTQTERMEIE